MNGATEAESKGLTIIDAIQSSTNIDLANVSEITYISYYGTITVTTITCKNANDEPINTIDRQPVTSIFLS